MTHTRLQAAGLFLLTSALQISAQTTTPNAITWAGSGYSFARPAQDAAPGQLMVIYLNGIKTSIPTPITVPPTPTGWPTSISGITVELVQGNPPVTMPVEIRAVQQAVCGQPEICSPITGITLQVPFALAGMPFQFPALRVSEGGNVVGSVLLRPVPDRVHILNTCDGTLISVGAASSVPQDVCAAAVMGAGRLNSLYNLAHTGDALMMWAYGLGALQRPVPVPCCSNPDDLPQPPVQPFQLNFDFRPNAPASPPVPGFGITASPNFAGYTGAGTYQINFVVPTIPPGVPACDGVKIKSNLTVTLSGLNSMDAAQICVAP